MLRKKIAIIGGGLSGLALAHRLESLGETDVQLYEPGHLGGLIKTSHKDGWVVDEGPESILRTKGNIETVIRGLNLSAEVIETQPEHRGALLVHKGQLERLPQGLDMMVFNTKEALFATTLLSKKGKARAALEQWIPPKPTAEESMTSFVTRRFGEEMFNNITQPLLSGIYGGDPQKLSMQETLPRFVEYEQNFGSVTAGHRAQSKENQSAAHGARYGQFISFKHGMQTLTDGFLKHLKHTHIKHEAVSRLGMLDVDHMVLACSVSKAKEWLAASMTHDPRLERLMSQFEMGSMAVVTLAYEQDAFERMPYTSGVVVPLVERKKSGNPVLAATFSSNKWPGRATSGSILLRVFIGGYPFVLPEQNSWLGLARGAMDAWWGEKKAPVWSQSNAYAKAMPQYHLGHRFRSNELEALLEHERIGKARIWLAGNGLHGVGIPDVIVHANRLASHIHRSDS